MADFNIVLGSKEQIIVDVTDATGTTTDLAPLSPQFDVVAVAEDGTETSRQSNVAASASGMRLQCLVDTTVVGYVKGLHRLYVEFTVGTEAPRVGPVEFYVI